MARLAAEAVAAGASSKSLAAIGEWIERFKRGELTDTNFTDKRQHVYQTLMDIGGNTELPQIMPTSLLHLLRLQSFPYLDAKKRKDVITEYAHMIEAVSKGDAKRAAQVGRAHVRAAQKRLASLPEKVFPDFQHED
jgi:DNA-binding GntR family transcriptional regulator